MGEAKRRKQQDPSFDKSVTHAHGQKKRPDLAAHPLKGCTYQLCVINKDGEPSLEF